MTRSLLLALSLCLPLLVGAQTEVQTAWPDKPIRIVLPYPPGGPSDIVMRAAGEKMLLSLKQPLVIENRPGAGGNLGTAEVARAAPDGYTWLVSTDTTFTVNPHVYKSLGFKPEDLTPVAMLTQFGQTLVCHPSVGVHSVTELVAKAKAQRMNYASGGLGVPGHLTMELLQSLAGFDMTHIPYKGPGPATQDVLGGQVPCGFLAGPTVLPHVAAGKLVALAVSSATRSPALPEVPTVAEAGIKGYEANFYLVAMAPKGTPDAVVQKFRQALLEALKAPDVVARLKASDQVVVGYDGSKTAAVLAADSKKWGEIARKIQLGLE